MMMGSYPRTSLPLGRTILGLVTSTGQMEGLLLSELSFLCPVHALDSQR